VVDAPAPAGTSVLPAAYPQSWEADVVLRDGGTCHLRPIRPDDAAGLVALHGRLSPQTVYFRFFAPYPRLSERDVVRFTIVDYRDRVALVATIGDAIIGVVRYDRVAPQEAEVAFVIEDEHQGRGLGTIFLEHIAQAARECGVRRFVAEVLPENARMLEIFEHAGYVAESSRDEGFIALSFDITPTASSLAVTHAREQRAEATAIARLVNPRSVAIVGASRDEASIGSALARHVVDGGFTGPVVAINPNAEGQVAGLPCFASLKDAPGPIDLAIVASPADTVVDVVHDAAAARVHSLVVVSSGFGESGPEGWRAQEALLRSARELGLRVLGPNALGFINTAPDVRLNASLSPHFPQAGPIGFFAQSGAPGAALLEAASRRGLGMSTFVSAGNRADISGNDLLQYWEDDEATELVMLYLESIGNPRKFSRIARRLGARKPIVAVRAGRSTQGAPLGHAVRTTGLDPEAVEQTFIQSGVIRTETIAEMYDVAQLLASQPLPTGRRVLAMSNSDAMTLMAADAVSGAGLQWVDPPIVFGAGATVEEFERALAAAVDDPAVESILAMYVPDLHHTGARAVAALQRVAARASTPILAVMFSVEGTHRLLDTLTEGRPQLGTVPTYPAVEDAVRALAAVQRHAEWRLHATDNPVVPVGIDVESARHDVSRWLVDLDGEIDLTEGQVSTLLAHYGIHVWPRRTARTADEAALAASELGYPVVLKTVDDHLRLRSDLGGVYFDIVDESELRYQFHARLADLGQHDYDRLVVQRQADAGVSTVIETVEDVLFGPVVTFGLSGVAYDVMGDRAYAVPPLSEHDVQLLLDRPAAAELLRRGRSGHAVDREMLGDLVARAARLADDLPEVARLVLRPVVASETGVAVLGATITLRRPETRTDLPARRLLG
jgi:acyl-CoA synthetase (NDP forming)/RimJ/RimL family protein N-acetyltransferase